MQLHSNNTLLPSGLTSATLTVEQGIITAIAQGPAPAGAQSVGDLVLMPGCIDVHVHLNEPGRTHWEGFETGTRAALAGGVTSLVDMPLNSSPVTTTPAAFQQKLEAANGKLHSNVAFWGGLVPGNVPQLEPLLEAGTSGTKAFLTHSGIDEFAKVGHKELFEGMKVLAKHRAPLLVHCELERPHAGTKVLARHPNSYAAWLQSRPESYELCAIELVLEGSRQTGCTVHVVHLSAASALPLIEAAKAEGLPVTAETCPHYVWLDADTIPDGDPRYKCAPPIRSRANNNQLIEALKSGLLDFVASDHSPAPPDIKELETGNIAKAWGGIASVQLTLPLMNSLRLQHNLSIETLGRWLCSAPASFMNWQNRGTLQVGAVADLVAWNPDAAFTVDAAALHHRHPVTPYHGQTLHGVVQQVWLGGQLAFDNNTFPAGPIGQPILRQRETTT